MRMPVAAALIAVSVMMTACGTTVRTTAGGAPATGVQQPGLGSGGVGGQAGSGTSGATDGAATGLGSLGSGGSAVGSRGPAGQNTVGTQPDQQAGPIATAGSGSSGRFSGPGLSRPGLSATEIHIGIQTVNAADALFAANGIGTGGSTGNQGDQWQAVVDYLNAHGGIAGRKIVPEFNDVNLARLVADGNAEAQAQCTYFTQDRKVYAVFTLVGFNDTWTECLAKARTALINPDIGYDSATLARYPDTVFLPAKMNATRARATTVGALDDNGWFGGWDTKAATTGKQPLRIGLLAFANTNADQDGLLPALRARGYKVDKTFEITATNAQDLQAQYQSAVLQFAAAGITHVFGADFTFAKQADNQSYYPRLELTTAQNPDTNSANYPAKSMLGMMGIGWAPLADTRTDPGNVSPAVAVCDEIMKRAGQDSSARLTRYLHRSECDAGFFLAAALAPGRGDPQYLRESVESVGTAFRSAITFRTRFGRGQHDGVAAYRALRFAQSCTCFEYISPLRPA